MSLEVKGESNSEANAQSYPPTDDCVRSNTACGSGRHASLQPYS